MTGSRSKDPLGETCKKALMKVYIKEKYGREKKVENKFLEKGTLMEEDAIDLISVEKMKLFKKNDERLRNDFVCGEPDLFEGVSIKSAERIIDLKCSWSIHTFMETLCTPSNKDYDWQLQGYMWLTGAREASLIYCLLNTPLHIIEREKQRAKWNYAHLAIDIDLYEPYIEECARIDRESIFDDIPQNERYIEFIKPYNPEMIEELEEKIPLCRKFLNELR
jgi:hypothetical protein